MFHSKKTTAVWPVYCQINDMLELATCRQLILVLQISQIVSRGDNNFEPFFTTRRTPVGVFSENNEKILFYSVSHRSFFKI
jgi:hypothetical protein